MGRWLLVIMAALALAAPAGAQSNIVILSTTTSTQDSGLLDVLVPMFERKSGLSVKTISVGTGQALALAARGEADVTLAPTLRASRRDTWTRARCAAGASSCTTILWSSGPPRTPPG